MRNYIMVRRNHYTEEELLKKLKDWAMNNNKNPTFHDIDTDKEIPCGRTYRRVFGSFNKAKELAGLKTNKSFLQNPYSDEELLQKLLDWCIKHKRNPSLRDIKQDKTMPSITTYKRRFGGFNEAKKLAGLEINRNFNANSYTRNELLEKLKSWSTTHNKNPTLQDIQEDKSMPAINTYCNYFGSFNKAKKLAGLEIYGYTEEGLLEKLREWARLHKKSPTVNDIKNDNDMPSSITYRRAFGSFNKAKELAGLTLFEHDSELNYVTGSLKEWWYEREELLAESTRKQYLRKLIKLEDFLKKNDKAMDEISITDVENYIMEIRDRYAKGTVEQTMSAIKDFLQYCHRKKKPFANLDLIEDVKEFLKKQLRKMDDDAEEEPALSENEVEIIKKKLKNYPLLDNMFRLDLILGLRASEFDKIKVTEGTILTKKQARNDDIWLDLKRGVLMIYRGKGNRFHLIALTKEMKRLVKKQLMLRKLYRVEHEYLFFSKRGKRLKKYSVISYYKQISKIVGFRVVSHMVRRTMATQFEKHGVPHSIIRKRMGHKPDDGTRHYQRYPIEEQIEILEKNVGTL